MKIPRTIAPSTNLLTREAVAEDSEQTLPPAYRSQASALTELGISSRVPVYCKYLRGQCRQRQFRTVGFENTVLTNDNLMVLHASRE